MCKNHSAAQTGYWAIRESLVARRTAHKARLGSVRRVNVIFPERQGGNSLRSTNWSITSMSRLSARWLQKTRPGGMGHLKLRPGGLPVKTVCTGNRFLSAAAVAGGSQVSLISNGFTRHVSGDGLAFSVPICMLLLPTKRNASVFTTDFYLATLSSISIQKKRYPSKICILSRFV